MLYFTADSHINHSKILTITWRGKYFKDIEEHDNAIIEGINSKVKSKHDRLYILGDVAFYDALAKFRRQLTCKNIVVIIGNHDKEKQLKEVFGRCNVFWQRTVKLHDGTPSFLAHFPHLYWAKSHYNSIHLFGHLHNEYQDLIYQRFPDMRSLDVGVDSAKEKLGRFEPFSEEEVLELMKDRAGHHIINKD